MAGPEGKFVDQSLSKKEGKESTEKKEKREKKGEKADRVAT